MIVDDQWEAYWEAKERRERDDQQRRIKRHREDVRHKSQAPERSLEDIQQAYNKVKNG